MDNPKTNIFKQFILSFYSFKEYPTFIRSKGTRIFLYVLLMSFITYIMSFIIPISSILIGVSRINTDLVDEVLPDFQISQGRFTIEEDFIFDNSEYGSIFLAGLARDLEMDEVQSYREVLEGYQNGIVIYQSGILINQDGDITHNNLNMLPYMSLEDLHDILPIIKVTIFILCIIIFIIYVILYLFSCLIWTLIAKLINVFIKAPILFGSLFNLVVYAKTAPVILDNLLNLNFIPVYTLIILYIVYGLKTIKSSDMVIHQHN